ncbi:hypothetical protein ZIOFF_076048 [Zingiber officinale]|uniref:Uncharacterized protein n=1 Tax=Zingiber officinale TaxID=94328 RepID=A0A8J5BSY5_ZINOF|nr:hypothetical protein ZIOFF_076048 [Zingiber officinale]
MEEENVAQARALKEEASARNRALEVEVAARNCALEEEVAAKAHDVEEDKAAKINAMDEELPPKKDHLCNTDLTEDGTSAKEPIAPTETKQLTIEDVAIEEKMTGGDKTAPQDVGDNMLSSTLVENTIDVPHGVSNSSDMEVVTNSDEID